MKILILILYPQSRNQSTGCSSNHGTNGKRMILCDKISKKMRFNYQTVLIVSIEFEINLKEHIEATRYVFSASI